MLRIRISHTCFILLLAGQVCLANGWITKPKPNKYENISGYVNLTEVGGGAGLGITSVPYSEYFLSVTTINGYIINRHFLTGIGVGLNGYNGGVLAPVYIDLRYSFNKHKFTPYLFADGGMLLNFEDIQEPGLFMNPGFGIFIQLLDNFDINLGIGFLVQRTPDLASFINIKLGIIFTPNRNKSCKLSFRGLR